MAMPGLGSGPEQTWLAPSLAGTNSPTPKGSPPGGGSSSSRSSNRIRAVGASVAMAGQTDGWTNGRKHQGRGAAAAPGTRAATRFFATPRRVPGTPPRRKRRKEGEAGEGMRTPSQRPWPYTSRVRTRSRDGPSCLLPSGYFPAPTPSGRRGSRREPAPTLERLLCAPETDTAPPRAWDSSRAQRILPLQELPEDQVTCCDSAHSTPGHAVSAQQMLVPFRKSNPEASRDPSSEHTTSPLPWGEASIAVVTNPPVPAGSARDLGKPGSSGLVRGIESSSSQAHTRRLEIQGSACWHTSLPAPSMCLSQDSEMEHGRQWSCPALWGTQLERCLTLGCCNKAPQTQ